MNKILNIIGIVGFVMFSGFAATLPILDSPNCFKIAGIGLLAGICLLFNEKKNPVRRPSGWTFIKHGD